MLIYLSVQSYWALLCIDKMSACYRRTMNGTTRLHRGIRAVISRRNGRTKSRLAVGVYPNKC